MGKIENTGKELTDQAEHFLANRPIWMWWAAYILLMAVLFAIVWLVISVFQGIWWVIALLAVVAGFVWGTIAYTNKGPKKGKKSA